MNSSKHMNLLLMATPLISRALTLYADFLEEKVADIANQLQNTEEKYKAAMLRVADLEAENKTLKESIK